MVSSEADIPIDDAEPEPVPPAAARVAHRALVLASLSCRSDLERDSADPATLPFHARLLEWCRRVPRLIDEFEPDEWALVLADVGSLSEREQINASWRAEALGVLAWALGSYELPEWEAQVDPPAIGAAIGFLEEAGVSLAERVSLRDPEEIEALADEILALHWRLREFSLRPGHMDFRTFASECAWANMPVERLRFIDSDLAIGDVPIAQASEDLWRERLSIVQERHQAVNWLLGYESTYSMVTTDT